MPPDQRINIDSMYVRLARFIAVRPKKLMVFWAIIVVAAALVATTGFGTPLWDRLVSDVPQATPSESNQGQKIVEKQSTAAYSVMAYISGIDLSKEMDQAPDLAQKLEDLRQEAQSQGDQAQELGQQAQAAGKPAQELGQEAQNLGARATRLGNQAREMSSQAQTWGKQAQQQGQAARDLQAQAESLGAQAAAAGQTARELQAQAEAAGGKAQALAQSGDLAGSQVAAAQAQDLGAQAAAAAQQAQNLESQARTKGQEAAALGQEAASLAADAKSMGNLAQSRGNQARELGNQAQSTGAKAKEQGQTAQDLANQAQARGAQAEALGQQAQEVAKPDWPVAKSLHQVLSQLEADLKQLPEVSEVSYPFVEYNALLDPQARELVAKNKQGFVFVVTLDLTGGLEPQKNPSDKMMPVVQEMESRLAQLEGQIRAGVASTALLDDFQVRVTDQALAHSAGIDTLKNDLLRSELIGFPLSFIIMALVFGGFAAALMPLSGALVAISAALAIMLGMTYLFEQQSFAVNVISVLGLGLSIDYGLLIVSRFREELVRLRGLPQSQWAPDFSRVKREKTRRRLEQLNPRYLRALEITLSTAGRTTLFSALTVSVSASGMLLFKPELLKSLGIAGFSVVLLAMIAALTLVSALMIQFAAVFEKPSVLSRIPLLRSWVRSSDPQLHMEQENAFHQYLTDADSRGSRGRESRVANAARRRRAKLSFFERFSIFITRRPWISFIVSAALLVAAWIPSLAPPASSCH